MPAKGELARFRVEAEAIARLQHPNIVAVYEIGEHDGQPFFSLEYCPGGSLDRRLKGTPLADTDAARLVRALADAMFAAHQANVIHRDLKPANVLLASGGGHSSVLSGAAPADPAAASSAATLNQFIPKITDFGLAKKLDDVGQTHTGAIMGTPSYMAPEQAEGKKDIGPLADVYALGAILYECLTGRPPFRAATPYDTILQVISEEPVAPRQLNPKIDADLETICLKCLRKEPQARYASAAALADDLGRFLTDEPISARPVSRVEWAIKWARRRPTTAALFAVVTLAVVLAIVGGWFYGLYQDGQSRLLTQQVQRTRQTTALFAEGQEAESAARLALVAGRDAAAIEAFVRAEGALERAVTALAAAQDPADDALRTQVEERLTAVRDELQALRRRQEARGKEEQARRQLQEQVARLGQQRDDVLFHHLGVVASEEAANRTAVRTLAAAALTPFGLDPGRPASAAKDALAPFVRHFASDAQRRDTALACFEVLLVWAQTERTAATSQPEADRARGLRLAADLLDRARALADGQRMPLPRSWTVERANLLAAQGDEAAAKTERAQADREPSTTALDDFLLALEAYRRGQTDRAVAGCEEALRRQPGYFWPHYLLGLCHLKERRWAQADAWLSTCVSQRPEYFWPRVLRASARIELNSLAGADSDLTTALRQAASPTMRHLVHLNRSRLAIVRKQWAEARDELKAAIACQPTGGYQAHTNLAQVYRQLSDLPAARAELDRHRHPADRRATVLHERRSPPSRETRRRRGPTSSRRSATPVKARRGSWPPPMSS
ncbi:MAG: protein kinase [Gemmataceae bacterium]